MKIQPSSPSSHAVLSIVGFLAISTTSCISSAPVTKPAAPQFSDEDEGPQPGSSLPAECRGPIDQSDAHRAAIARVAGCYKPTVAEGSSFPALIDLKARPKLPEARWGEGIVCYDEDSTAPGGLVERSCPLMGERGFYEAIAFGGDPIFSTRMRIWRVNKSGRFVVDFSGGRSGVILCLTDLPDGRLVGESVRWQDYGPFDAPVVPIELTPTQCNITKVTRTPPEAAP